VTTLGFLKKHEPSEGFRSIIDDPEICEYIRFGVIDLSAGSGYQGTTGEDEACLVLLGGRCTVSAANGHWAGIGGRRNVFDGRPYSLYLPRETDFDITADSDCSLAACMAHAGESREAKLIPPESVKCRSVGEWNWRRDVCDIMGNDSNVPETLIVGETYNPPGNWSSSPPHKHDVDNLPRESKLEEVYYFKLRPRQGFGLQRVYSEEGDLDEAYVIEDGDTVAFPRGYHPVAAAPGYELYYLWVLAGKRRVMCPNDDPNHAWLKGAESIVKEITG
jgi:5-deoxy-glucuronate isomerase